MATDLAALRSPVPPTRREIPHTVSPGLDGGWPAKLGLRGVSDEAFPRITVAGVAALGAATHERRQFPILQHQFVDTLSYVRGRHARTPARRAARPDARIKTSTISVSSNPCAEPPGQVRRWRNSS